jgi:nitroreductase
VPGEILQRLLEALRLAPSGSNRQPWWFVVVRDRAKIAQLAEACRYVNWEGRLRVQRWVAEAPIVIVACGSEAETAASRFEDGELLIATGGAMRDDRGLEAGEYTSLLRGDLSIALDHLSLAAVAEGLGTCWIAGLNEPEVKRILSIPDEVIAPLAMTLGYPSRLTAPRTRKSLEEIVRYDAYAQ